MILSLKFEKGAATAAGFEEKKDGYGSDGAAE